MGAIKDIQKDGIGATDVQVDATLTPAEANTFIDAIVAQDEFLQIITVDKAGKLTKKRNGIASIKGGLTRFISGVAVSDAALKKLGVVGCVLDMSKGVTLNAMVLKETIDDNQDNPDFEDEQFDGFAQSFSNDLVYLGMVGTDDNAAEDAPFAELAKGWVTIAKASANTMKIQSSNTSFIERLKHLVKNVHEDAKGKVSIFMSPSDYDDYLIEIATLTKSAALLLKAGERSFMGKPIILINDLPVGTFMATLPKNIVFGIAKDIEKSRWYDNERSALRYKFVVHPDYEFDIHKYVTLSEPGNFTITSYVAEVVVGANTQRTVQETAMGLNNVTVNSSDESIATVAYNSGTGVITITGVAAGSAIIIVDDSTSTKEIAVTVTAA